jgi:DNA end-binding protein Ku
MAARAYWKGYLRLSLVSCPIALFPATSEREKVSFHQLNRKTGNRIRYHKVDDGTGEEVPSDDIVSGYEVSKGQYIEITGDELEAVALESTRTIDIDEFVPRSEIDELYIIRPYYIAPDGKAGQDAFVIIREVIEQMRRVAIGRIVLTSREHIIALEPRGKGIIGTLLRFPYEVRDKTPYFEGISDTKLGKDAVELAKHIVETKSAHFRPERFKDRYEKALRDLIARKQAGKAIEAPQPAETSNVINLMDALRQSVEAQGMSSKKSSAPSRKERAKRPPAHLKKAGRSAARHRKAG